MGNLDLKDDGQAAAQIAARAAADLAAQSEAIAVCPIPNVPKPEDHSEAALHLACEGDTLESDDLEISADSLPLFGTHGSRHLG